MLELLLRATAFANKHDTYLLTYLSAKYHDSDLPEKESRSDGNASLLATSRSKDSLVNSSADIPFELNKGNHAESQFH